MRGRGLCLSLLMRNPTSDDGVYATGPARVLLPLLGIYIAGTITLQGFNLVYLQIGEAIGAGDSVALITAVPGIVLGVACFLYGSLGDFVPLRRIVDAGAVLIAAGSLLGLVASSSLWGVIVARALQILGCQAAASVYMILATSITDPRRRALYVGLMAAAFQGATAIGLVVGGWLARVNWVLLLLVPLIGLACVPVMGRRVPARSRSGRIDVFGLAVFSCCALTLTVAASNRSWLLLVVLVALIAVFWAYIGRAREPFITRSFFTNTRWLRAISLILLPYTLTFAIAPIAARIGQDYYGMDASDVSLMLMPAYLVALASAVASAAVVNRIGRGAAVRLSVAVIGAGAVLMAVRMDAGTWVLIVSMTMVYAGYGMLFSPVYSTVLATVAPGQTGRGVAMNDLAMQGTSAVGIGIATPWIASGSVAGVLLAYAVIAALVVGIDWWHEAGEARLEGAR